MLDKKYSRYFDLFEKSWLAADRQGRPQAFMLIIEGTGDIPDRDMNEALYQVSHLYPVSYSKLTGFMKSLRWKGAEHFPRMIRLPSIHHPFSNIPCEEEKRILWEKMDIRKKSPIAVYTLSNDQKRRFYIKIHHTAMDGMGLDFFVHDVFSVLRGEKPTGGTTEFETKENLYSASLPDDFFKSRQEEYNIQKNEDETKPDKKGGSFFINDVYVGDHIIGTPEHDNQFEWQSLPISYSELSTSQLNGKMLSAITDTFKELTPDIGNKKFQACVPIDLRYLKPGLRTASNLTSLIMVELDKYLDLPKVDRISAIISHIREIAGNHSAVVQISKISAWIPVSLMSFLIYIFRKYVFYRKKYPCYVFFSNVGRWDLNAISAKSFTAERINNIPNMQFYCPLFILVSTHDHGIEIICATDTSQKALARFVDLFKKNLISTENSINS